MHACQWPETAADTAWVRSQQGALERGSKLGLLLGLLLDLLLRQKLALLGQG